MCVGDYRVTPLLVSSCVLEITELHHCWCRRVCWRLQSYTIAGVVVCVGDYRVTPLLLSVCVQKMVQSYIIVVVAGCVADYRVTPLILSLCVQEMFAYGVCSAMSSLFSGIVASASMSLSTVQDGTGGVSQVGSCPASVSALSLSSGGVVAVAVAVAVVVVLSLSSCVCVCA